MEKRVIIGLAACVMVLSVLSCAKEQQKEDPQEDQNGLVTEILSATKEGDATKVTMNSGREFGWSALDDVAFTIYKGGSYEFRTSDHYGETPTGKFVVTHSGIRQGYAVMPASFQGSYDGSTLVVNYPDSYDISADVDGGCYDNADAAHFIPFPMVSKSIPESAELTFYSIGAMAKVTVSDVPAGTKNLYITFNKPVTGNFPVTGLDTFNDPDPKPAPQVSCSGKANTTITVKISESGLVSQQTITLYIPIPVCDEGLKLLSSTAYPKAKMYRNRGYAFTTSAISSHVDNQPYFELDGKWYEIAPGNLANTSGVSGDWYFLGNQLTTLLSEHTTTPAYNNRRDVFRYYELESNSIFAPMKESTLVGYLPASLKGKDNTERSDWKMMSSTVAGALINANNNTGWVGITTDAHFARVLVDVSGTAMSSSALLDEDYSNTGEKTKIYVPGDIFFPAYYFDLTDQISTNINTRGISDYTDISIISYNAFELMVNAGAIFMVSGGRYTTAWSQVGGKTYAMYMSGTSDGGNYYAISWNNATYVVNLMGKGYYTAIRLIRELDGNPKTGDITVSQADDWTWE